MRFNPSAIKSLATVFFVLNFILIFKDTFSAPFVYKSQKSQDKWVIEEVFNFKKNGFFVDLAASDGITGSNSFILEKELGWKGICIEPNPNFFKKLITIRSSINVQSCIDETNKKILFYENGSLGGIVDEDTDNNYRLRADWLKEAYQKNKILTFYTKTLEQVLDENDAPLVIDYLSLDIEGAETRVLRRFPFHKYIFLALTIERPTPEINELLFKNGYVFVKNVFFDSFYVHESIPNFDIIKKEPFSQIPPKDW